MKDFAGTVVNIASHVHSGMDILRGVLGRNEKSDSKDDALKASPSGRGAIDETLFMHAVFNLYAKEKESLGDDWLSTVTNLFSSLKLNEKRKLVLIIGLGEQEVSDEEKKPTDKKNKSGDPVFETKTKKWMENKRGMEILRGMANFTVDELKDFIENTGVVTSNWDTIKFYLGALNEARVDLVEWWNQSELKPLIIRYGGSALAWIRENIPAYVESVDQTMARKVAEQKRNARKYWWELGALIVVAIIIANI